MAQQLKGHKSTGLKLWTGAGVLGFRVKVDEDATKMTTPGDRPLDIPHHLRVGAVSFLDPALNAKLDGVDATIDEILRMIETQDATLNPDTASKVDVVVGQVVEMRGDVAFLQRKLTAAFP